MIFTALLGFLQEDGFRVVFYEAKYACVLHHTALLVGLLAAVMGPNAAKWGTSTKLLRVVTMTQNYDLKIRPQMGVPGVPFFGDNFDRK